VKRGGSRSHKRVQLLHNSLAFLNVISTVRCRTTEYTPVTIVGAGGFNRFVQE
jgi:hypothetical protein